MTDRAALGRATYARNFGVPEAEAEALMTARGGVAFTHEAFEAAGGPGWQSVAISDRDRAVAVIAALVGQGVTDDRLAIYLSLARRNGVDDEGLTALMILLAAYVGQPRTSLAMEAIHRPESAPADSRQPHPAPDRRKPEKKD